MNRIKETRWQTIVAMVGAEYALLPAVEKRWICTRLEQIEALQRQLDQLFSAADGETVCRCCRGDCCAHGHNHLTLANLLSFICREEQPPRADFSRTCPFLDSSGCVLAVESRPYNCITFICDKIEAALAPQDRARFYDCDQSLRNLYRDFAARYPGAAMTGVLIADQRLAGRSFFGDFC
jgi:hypothetical protein